MSLAFLELIFLFKKIYLAVPGLSCGTRILHYSMQDLVPWPGVEPGLPALTMQSLDHWITREIPMELTFFFFLFFSWSLLSRLQRQTKKLSLNIYLSYELSYELLYYHSDHFSPYLTKLYLPLAMCLAHMCVNTFAHMCVCHILTPHKAGTMPYSLCVPSPTPAVVHRACHIMPATR